MNLTRNLGIFLIVSSIQFFEFVKRQTLYTRGKNPFKIVLISTGKTSGLESDQKFEKKATIQYKFVRFVGEQYLVLKGNE